MTRDEVDRLRVGDVIEFTRFDTSDEQPWVVKEIDHGSNGAVHGVRIHPIGAHYIHTITITVTGLPNNWTLVERAKQPIHPLEQLRQRLDNNNDS